MPMRKTIFPFHAPNIVIAKKGLRQMNISNASDRNAGSSAGSRESILILIVAVTVQTAMQHSAAIASLSTIPSMTSLPRKNPSACRVGQKLRGTRSRPCLTWWWPADRRYRHRCQGWCPPDKEMAGRRNRSHLQDPAGIWGTSSPANSASISIRSRSSRLTTENSSKALICLARRDAHSRRM